MKRGCPALEELVCANGKILARGLSTNRPSCSSQPPPRSQTKSREDFITTKRSALVTDLDCVVDEFCLPSLQDGMESSKRNSTALHDDQHDTRFGMVLEDTEDFGYYDHKQHVREPQVVPVYKDGNPRTSDTSLFVEGIPDQLAIARNIDELDKFSMATFADPSDRQAVKDGETPLSKRGLITNAKLQKVNSRSGKHWKFQNFSLINNIATGEVSGAAKPTSGSRSPALEHLKSNYVKPPPEGGGDPSVLRPYGLIKGLQGLQNRLYPTETTLEVTRPIGKPPELSPTPDEQSQAQAPGFASGSPANTIKEKPYAGKLVDQEIPTTSTCSSRGASNDVEVIRWRYENTNGVASPSKNVKKEQVPAARRSGAGRVKRKTKEGLKLTKKRTDYKINKKMRELQKLIPNARKADKASILDEAIQYLMALQQQVQIMSMGNRIAMPPIMLPTEMQRMQASYVAPFSRMNVGFGYSTPLAFSASTIPGLEGLVLQTSMSGAPFIPPFNGGHPTENLW